MFKAVLDNITHEELMECLAATSIDELFVSRIASNKSELIKHIEELKPEDLVRVGDLTIILKTYAGEALENFMKDYGEIEGLWIAIYFLEQARKARDAE